MSESVIELFAGPGGMSEGMRNAGIEHVGIEWDADACATARAAGHVRIKADIADLNPVDFSATGLHGSPPCQGFSGAGNGLGRKDTASILTAVDMIAQNGDADAAIKWLHDIALDPRSALVLEPLRWALALDPEWVSLEQVPSVLPLWEAMADVLREMGYSAWTANVQAEQYGVPQSRKRAVLLASRVRTVTPMVPTHSKYHQRTPDRLDENVLPWVSMETALGWAPTDMVGFPRRTDGHGGVVEIDGEVYRERDLRIASLPAFVLTEKARSWSRYSYRSTTMKNGACRPADRPAPTIAFGHDSASAQWVHGATLLGRVTVDEAAVLQSFPADYPWQGSRTSRYAQIGNAVPPVLAAAMIRHLHNGEIA